MKKYPTPRPGKTNAARVFTRLAAASPHIQIRIRSPVATSAMANEKFAQTESAALMEIRAAALYGDPPRCLCLTASVIAHVRKASARLYQIGRASCRERV